MTERSFVEEVDAEALAELLAFNEDLKAKSVNSPFLLPPQELRRRQQEGISPYRPPVQVPQAWERTIPARSGEIAVRVIPPTSCERRGIYLHLHGGGFTSGARNLQDVRLSRLAEATGLCAVSFDYRLAPEHPFPAAPDDCEDTALWMLEHGPRELGTPEYLTLGGESSGGHLSALTLIRLRDRHGVTDGFRAANLVFGTYDLSGTPSSRLHAPGDSHMPVIDLKDGGAFATFVPGRDAEALRDPEVSPLYADLRNLPPALFTVGTRDPLLDDSAFMYSRWRLAGNHAELRVWPEAMHGFTSAPRPGAIASAALERMYAFLTAPVGVPA